MIKTLEFGDKKVSFSTSFAWTFKYKSQFGKDAAKVLMPTIKKTQDPHPSHGKPLTPEDQAYILYEELGFTGIAEIAWSMASLLDRNIPDPVTWIASFGDDFNSFDLIELVIDAIESCFSTKKSPAPTQTNQKKTTAEPKK